MIAVSISNTKDNRNRVFSAQALPLQSSRLETTTLVMLLSELRSGDLFQQVLCLAMEDATRSGVGADDLLFRGTCTQSA